MSEIKTWQERCLERGIGSCEARDEELIELRAALADRDASLENTRVQLAGCGVAAMQNTEASKADRGKPGDYGWSASYSDVCRAVDREIDLRAKLTALEAIAYSDDGADGEGMKLFLENREMKARLAALEKQEPVAWMNNKRDMTYFGHYNKDDLPLFAAAGAAPVPSELVLTFNFGTLVKVVFQDRVLYEIDLSSKSYWQVCWAHGWAGDYESEEDARNECLSLCGYGRSIREVKPGDDGYKNPRQPKLTERRIPIYAAASTAPVPEGWQLVPIEPTPDMCEVVTWDFNRFYAPHEIYKAMLKLAPKDAP